MTHVTYHDCLEHISTGKPLSCTCEECVKRVESVRLEQSLPQRIMENLPPSFWQERSFVSTKRAAWWMRPMPILAAAALLLLTVGLILVNGSRRSKPVTSVIASMPESEQERLYLEVENLLSQPPLGDLDLLAEDAPAADTHTFNGERFEVPSPVRIAGFTFGKTLSPQSFGSSDTTPAETAGKNQIKGVTHEA